jgi:hypothetical protein
MPCYNYITSQKSLSASNHIKDTTLWENKIFPCQVSNIPTTSDNIQNNINNDISFSTLTTLLKNAGALVSAFVDERLLELSNCSLNDNNISSKIEKEKSNEKEE